MTRNEIHLVSCSVSHFVKLGQSDLISVTIWECKYLYVCVCPNISGDNVECVAKGSSKRSDVSWWGF